MNGYTNPSTRGANIAESKGMALSISAGNSGGSSWTCVDSPSDAVDVLCIGAVDSAGHYASFSSTGTVNGTYVKPNLAAMGVNVIVASPDTSFGNSTGSSFASPVNAGLMACLWQARPNLNPSQLYLAIERSPSQYNHPDSLLGYGIPNYDLALEYAQTSIKNKTSFSVYPNPFKDAFNISFDSNISGNIEVSLISVTGDVILKTRKIISAGGGSSIRINNIPDLIPGMYILKVTSECTSENFHLVKIEN